MKNQSPTFGDLWSEPLPTLYGRVVDFKRDDLRWRRRHSWWSGDQDLWFKATLTVLGMRMLRWTPGVAYRRLQTLVAMVSFIRDIDHIIDPHDVHMPYEGTPRDHFEQATRLVNALSTPHVIADEVAFPEMVLAVYAYRAAKEQFGFDMAPQLRSMWEKDIPDLERVLSNEMFADQATLDLAISCFEDCIALAVQITGVPAPVARLSARLWINPLRTGDMLADFLADLRDGNMQVSREELAAWGVDIDSLLQCKDVDDLAELSGFPKWFYAVAARNEQAWLNDQPTVEALLLPHVVPGVARLALRRKLRKLHETLRIERERFMYDLPDSTLEAA